MTAAEPTAMPPSPPPSATLEDFWAIPEAERFHELIGGQITPRTSPSGEHGGTQAGLVIAIGSPFQRAPGRGGPGGWWIATEVEVLLEATEIVRPDVLGWRREHCPERPTGTPVRQRPDWICEVVSASVDPRDATLTVMRWSAEGYVTLLLAERGEVVRAEPFEAIELPVGTLFGDDPPER
jgi:Uma2 family endonuclease